MFIYEKFNFLALPKHMNANELMRFVFMYELEILEAQEGIKNRVDKSCSKIDKKFRNYFRPQAYYYSYIKQNCFPVVTVKNSILLDMLQNTDTDMEALKNILLPFNDFLLELNGIEYSAEVVISKVKYDISWMKMRSDTPEYFYTIKGYMYKNDSKKEIHDFQFSSILKTFDYKNVPDHIKIPMENIVKLILSVLFYMSTEKAKTYIEKDRPLLKKQLQNMRANRIVTATPLFNNIVYKYQSNSSGDSNTKSSHLRRGHFRHQPYGQRDNPLYKTIWIEPYYTGQEEITKQKKYTL